MLHSQLPTIASLLVQHIPRDLIMGVEDSLFVGALRGTNAGAGMNPGHRSHAVGQMRHFHMNETFRDALEAAGTNPSQIKGNRVVIAKAGIFALGRFNISNGVWNNGRRSRTRREMAMANLSIEPLVMPDLFDTYQPATKATVFFVGVFDRSVQDTAAVPMSIDVAVPDHELKEWLFRMSTTEFLKLYDAPHVATAQPDLAVPLLKPGIAMGQNQKSGT
ncbi:alpha/beta hydrolase [Rhodoferax sp.]|uniref:alpha/beta hydrolase n=1 Tax=Rhodoferax sp. TaxID=50421 RepID=UPI00262B8D36|nr:alpha/beta hydrolase [Rhodoferax sp.]MDD3936867.1 alpha/beta hydrolase [Rhodoferax sp.]